MNKKIIELKTLLKNDISQSCIEKEQLNVNGSNDIAILKRYSDIFFDALDIAQETEIILTQKEVTNLFKVYINEIIDGMLQKENT